MAWFRRRNYLDDEVHRILNSVPLTRTEKRAIRKKLLEQLDERHAALLFLELKARAEGMKAVLDVIHRSSNLPRGRK